MQNSNPPVIAIITDFGTQDWYCGSIQGRILAGCPDARIVNISHAIPPGDVYTASYVLASCMADFPANTLFLCVVDPGVGTSRKALVGRIGPYTVIAPDNGLISHAARKYANNRGPFYEITPEAIPSGGISSTFHGRDIFAPVAARVASNAMRIKELGSIIQEPCLLESARPEVKRGMIAGHIRYIDHFGNGITDISRMDLELLNVKTSAYLLVGSRKIALRSTFGDVSEGMPLTYIGSNGFLEIGVNCGHAAQNLGLALGQEVRFLPEASASSLLEEEADPLPETGI
jgi:S-adenosyl-L-methionine hydrolase (adenosine-forming)